MSEDHETIESEPIKPKPPRVAIIASQRIAADFPLYLKYLLVGLADESVPVILVCPPGCEVDAAVPPAVEVIRHPTVNLPLLQHYNLRLLLKRLLPFKPELLHCLCETKANLVRWLARQLNLNYLLNVNSIFSRFHHITVSNSRCAAIVVPAGTIAGNFAALHPKLADRVCTINMGTFVQSSVAAFANPHRLPGIVMAHSLDNLAQIDNHFDSFHRLAVDNYQFMVAFVGAGRDEKYLRKKLRSLGLLRIVTIVPRLPSFDSALAAADIFISPRPSSSFNSLLLSAMAAGSAVAACKGGVDDLIIDGKTAFVFNPDDRLSIYNCLKRIFDTPDLARQIAAGAQDYLRRNHHVSAMVSSTLALYHKAARPQQAKTESSAA
jgi:glycosyltransferase involved in cell wall biosynthesis